MEKKSKVSGLGGIPLAAGIWLLIAPFVLGYSTLAQALWNDLIVGVLLVTLALVRVFKPLRYAGVSWTIVALGVWLILAPFILGYGNFGNPGESVNTKGATWNDIIAGVIVLAIAAGNAMAIRGSTERT